jgi:hypothetical protein
MSKATLIQPWKKVCTLRKEIRERELTDEDFAVDLYLIANRPSGVTLPFYCDPDQFFATTYATENLRKFTSGILARLAGRKDGLSVLNIAQTFGGGKSHALATAYYLCTLKDKLPKKHYAVGEILAAAKMTDAPPARIAVVSFDKVDWKAGGLVKSPTGEVRHFRMPWNLIAWQLLGQRGLDLLERDESQPDYYEPPAQPLWTQLLAEVEKEGCGALILLDEFLMWAHGAASPDPDATRKDKGPVWYGRLKNFYQYLSQAALASDKSCLVVSLLATDPTKRDDIGNEILAQCNAGLNRLAEVQTPVDNSDFAELLRRRMFEDFPKGSAACDKHVTAFWHRMTAAEPARAKSPDSKKEMIDAYPFHPDMLNRFFGKWSDLRQFQRTRGVLQTFASALREAEAWDESPLISTQVLLGNPTATDPLSLSLQKLAGIAMDSVDDANKPPWPNNLRSELPRARNAQERASTLTCREIEAACAGSFLYSQPAGEQAELGDLRWLVAATCEVPAMLNTGLLEWSKTSWYLSECESTDPASNLPRYWRLGPKPNLNQMHDAYKRNALKHARSTFDKLTKDCGPLRDGCVAQGVTYHQLPDSPDKVDDDGTFRLLVMGAAFAGTPGAAPKPEVVEYIRTHASLSDTREYQNVLLAVTPSATGLLQAEQAIAASLAWGEIRTSEAFKELEPEQRESVKRREKDAQKDALTCVKNSFELVLYVDADGSIQQKKITMGSEALFPTLLREKDLRLFNEQIDAEQLMPGGPLSKWPVGSPSMKVKDLYGAFGKYPDMPKLVNRKVLLKTIEDAVQRGLLALRYAPPGGEEWFWHAPIEGVMDWADFSEVWLPSKVTLTKLHPYAVLPDACAGLWPTDDSPVKLSTLCGLFDGTHAFDELVQAGYQPEKRPIPKADYKLVHKAVAAAVEKGQLWLVFGNDSLLGEKPTDLQLDPDACLYRQPLPLRTLDLLPGALPDAWDVTAKTTTVATLYTELKKQKGHPWPTRQFLEVLNEAVQQGMLARVAAGPEFTSLTADADRKLKLPTIIVDPPPPTPTPGVRETNEVALTLNQLQDFVEDAAPEMTKLLAGSTPEFMMRIRVKSSKNQIDVAAANALLSKIQTYWRFEP